jgi:hypothetical protein
MKKNTLILAGAFLALLILAFLVMEKPGERSVAVDAGRKLMTIDSAAVDKVELRSPSTTLVLEKKGTEWFLQQPVVYRADQTTVAQFIQQLKDMSVKSVVSSQPDKHAMFQVDSTGTVVTVHERGAERASIFVGKMGGGVTDLYARLAGSDEVVLASGASSHHFTRPLKDWRDKTVLTTPKDLINEVRFQYGDTTFALQLRDSVWMIGRDSTQEWSVESFLSSLSNLQADDFVDTPPSPLPAIVGTITVGDAQVRFHRHHDSGRYFVQTSASPQWFEVYSWRGDQVLKRKKDFARTSS